MIKRDRIEELERELDAVMLRSRSLKAEVVAALNKGDKPESDTRTGC